MGNLAKSHWKCKIYQIYQTPIFATMRTEFTRTHRTVGRFAIGHIEEVV